MTDRRATASVTGMPVRGAGTIRGVGFGLGVVLGVPSLLAGVWNLVRGRASSAGPRLFAFVGPALVLVVTEALPHALVPCGILPGVCEDVLGRDPGVTGRWHQLDHVLVGALPVVGLYWWTLRRWHPGLRPRSTGYGSIWPRRMR